MKLTAEDFSKLFEGRRNFENIAFSYVHDRDAAKDIVTDCFIYLWEHRDTLAGEDNIKGYLYMCVRARCISYIRRQQTASKARNEMSDIMNIRIKTSLSSLSDNELAQKLYHSEISGIFKKELMGMPALTKDIFLASREEDLTYQQIADRYNIPLRKVTFEIQRVLKILRKSLKDYISK